MKLSKASIVLLAVQLALVSSIAAKYLYQRHASPRVWTRAAAVDPSLPMRGRYLSLQLMVDGCSSTLPSAKLADFPRNTDGTVRFGSLFSIRGERTFAFPARLRVVNGKLLAIQPDGEENTRGAQTVVASPAHSCSEMSLRNPVNFYIAEHAASPLPLAPGQELWIEVTIPRNGPPRPLQLALTSNGVWTPLKLN